MEFQPEYTVILEKKLWQPYNRVFVQSLQNSTTYHYAIYSSQEFSIWVFQLHIVKFA